MNFLKTFKKDRTTWTFLFIGIALQLLWTLTAIHRFEYEDTAESIRNPYWVMHGEVYGGISSNIGWYATVLGFYKIFGFHLYTAKWIRILLQTLSVFAMSKIVQNFLTARSSQWIAFLFWALSPTMAYFNTQQTPLGIDLQMIPIILGIIFLWHPLKYSWRKPIALGATCIYGALCYPSFLFFFPGLAILYCGQSKNRMKDGLLVSLAASLVFLYFWSLFHFSNTFIYDVKTQSGVFRGGGAGTLQWNWDTVRSGIWATFKDLMIRPGSYYFHIRKPEYMIPFGWILVSISVFGMILKRKLLSRHYWSAYVVSAALALFIITSLPGPNGIRRTTLIWVIFQVSVMTWLWLSERAPLRWKTILARLALAQLAVIYFYDYSVLYQNTKDRGLEWWHARDTPIESYQYWFDQTKAGTILEGDRYQEIFSAIRLDYELNLKQVPHSIYGRDVQKEPLTGKWGEVIQLERDTWNKGRLRL